MTEPTTRGAVSDRAVEIVELDADGYGAAIPGLAELILDAVAGGSSVNFMAGVTAAEAAAWWEVRRDAIASGQTTAFVARHGGRIVGSTLLIRAVQANAPHRAEIAKVLVHRDARRRGLARALMLAAEAKALADGRWLLFLDTVTGSPADRLYRSLGWREAGPIPNYGLDPSGELVSATYFWKDLR